MISGRLRSAPEVPAVVLLIVATALFGILADGVLSVDTARNVLSQASMLTIMAIGFGMVLIAGHLDLSIGSTAALAGVLTMSLQPRGLWLSILVGLLAAAAVGLVNGALVTIARMPSLIATLGTLIAVRGLAFLASGGRPVQGGRLDLALALDQSRLGVLTVRILIMFAAVVAFDLLMRRTVWGRELLATGGGAVPARAAGVPVARRTIEVFTVSGLLAGLAGAVQALALNSASPTAGETALLVVVAAVVVGGTSLDGGRGTVAGALIGVLLVTGVSVYMNRAGIDSAYQRVLVGALLLGVVLVSRSRKEEVRRAPRRVTAQAVPPG